MSLELCHKKVLYAPSIMAKDILILSLNRNGFCFAQYVAFAVLLVCYECNGSNELLCCVIAQDVIMRNKEEILKEFKKLLEEEFEVDPQSITLDSLLYEDLDLDSIDAVDMIVYIQKKTKTKVKPEVFKSVRTVGDVVNVIDDLIQQSKTEHNS